MIGPVEDTAMKNHVKSLSLALMAGLFMAGPLSPGVGQAADEEVFTARQRAAIVQIVREAMKNDPGILSDAIRSMQQQASSQQEAHVKAAVRANWQALSTAPSYAVRGNTQGQVTVVEFLDPRCTYCRRMAPVVDQFLARHPDVRLVEKVIPVLGDASLLDAQAIYAAAFQGQYDAMRRRLMEETARPSLEHLRDVAKSLKLDVARFEKDLKGQAVMGLLTANLGQAQSVGVQGTPTFLFGQAAVAPGALGMEQMEQFLEAARKG
ncbi:DsbA family protein [Bombella mellum]|nr:DsbA family protein [Bombella mellum]